jgi:hypothetical protein
LIPNTSGDGRVLAANAHGLRVPPRPGLSRCTLFLF